MDKKIVAGLVVVLAIAAGLWFFIGQGGFGSSDTTNFDTVGVTSAKIGTGCNSSYTYASCTGAVITNALATFGFVTQGGGVTATTSTGAATLTEANVSVGLIEHTNAGATTITLPASSTITTLIPTAGQSFRLTYANLGTGIDTIAGGTGTLLHVASSTITTALKTVAPSGSAVFVWTRKSNTDIIVEMIPAQ